MRPLSRSAPYSRPGYLSRSGRHPLLFGRRLVKQYEIARDVHEFTPHELASLARMSVLGSAAPNSVRTRLLAAIDAWLNP